MAAPWKGNVRELDNALERAVILAEGPILTPDDFPPGLIAESEPRRRRATTSAPPSATTSASTSSASSRECGDDKREAARRLGLGLSSLYRKLEELGLRPA